MLRRGHRLTRVKDESIQTCESYEAPELKFVKRVRCAIANSRKDPAT